MVVEQYPDVITIVREAKSEYDPNTGEWSQGTSETIDFKCRFVPNLQARAIALADGTNYTYHYQVAFPLGTTNIKPQDTYKRGDEVGIIQRFEIGQLHSVAWI